MAKSLPNSSDLKRRALVRADTDQPAINLAAACTNAQVVSLEEFMKMIPNPPNIDLTITTIGTSPLLARETQEAQQRADTVLIATSDTTFTILTSQVEIRGRNKNLTDAGFIDIT